MNKLILQIGTCPLHIVHNSFRYGILALSFDFDRYALDIHFFFNLSAGRRADYKKMESVTNIVSHYAQKHVSTRWVALKKIVVKLLEQHENLKEYFLTYLPTTAGFKYVEKTDRYVITFRVNYPYPILHLLLTLLMLLRGFL